jgi:hypothetical protein
VDELKDEAAQMAENNKSKEEMSAPMVATESLMLSCVIDANERRNVMTADIPGAFMQADMDEILHMKLEGPLAKLLTRVDPNLYKKYTTIEKGKPVLYVQLMKALYGTLQAALLFWQDLTSQLEKWGFKLNPYDWCVANKMVNRKQCTILWHVDDLKILHVDPEVVEDILKLLFTINEEPVLLNEEIWRCSIITWPNCCSCPKELDLISKRPWHS